MAFKLLEMIVDLFVGGQPQVAQVLADVAAKARAARAAADPLAHLRANIDAGDARRSLAALSAEIARVQNQISGRQALGLNVAPQQARLGRLQAAAGVLGAATPGAGAVPQLAGVAQTLAAQFGAVTGAGTGVVSTLAGIAAATGPAAAGIAVLTAGVVTLGEAAHTFAGLHDEMTMFSAELTAMGKNAGAVVAGFEDMVRVGQQMGLTFSQARSIAMEAAQVTDGSKQAMENYMKVAVGLGRVMGGDYAAGQRLALAYGDRNRALQEEQVARYLRVYPRLRAEFIDAEKRGELASVTIARMAQRGLDMQDVFRNDTFQASWDRMVGALERAWQSVSKLFGPAVMSLIEAMAGLVGKLADSFSYLSDKAESAFQKMVDYKITLLKTDKVNLEIGKFGPSESERKAAEGLGKIPAPGAEVTHGGFLSMEAMSDALANAAFGRKGIPEQQLDEMRRQTAIQEEQLDKLRKAADKKPEGVVERRPWDGDLPGA